MTKNYELNSEIMFNPISNEKNSELKGYGKLKPSLRLGLYISPKKKLNAINVIFKQMLFEYNLLGEKPFPWNGMNKKFDSVEEGTSQDFVLLPYFNTFDGVLEKDELSSNKKMFYEKLVVAGIVLKRSLKLVGLAGGLEFFNCVSNEIPGDKEKFEEDMFKFENEEGTEDPLSRLDVFVPTFPAKMKTCDTELFNEVPVFFEKLEWNSFAIEEVNGVDMNLTYEADGKKLVIFADTSDLSILITDRELLYKRILEVVEKTKDVFEREENTLFKIPENVELIKKIASSFYAQLVYRLFRSIRFSQLVLPTSPLLQNKNAQTEFDIYKSNLRKFEISKSRLHKDEEKENIDALLEFRKLHTLKTYYDFLQSFFRRYFDEAIDFFICLKPSSKFDYDKCPVFFRELVDFINAKSLKNPIDWSGLIKIGFGYTTGDWKSIFEDLKTFTDYLFLYAKNKLGTLDNLEEIDFHLETFLENNLKVMNSKIDVVVEDKSDDKANDKVGEEVDENNDLVI